MKQLILDIIAARLVRILIIADGSVRHIRYFDGNLPEDNVPFADYDAPEDADNPEDSSSTAIVASSLFEVFELTGTARICYFTAHFFGGPPHDGRHLSNIRA